MSTITATRIHSTAAALRPEPRRVSLDNGVHWLDAEAALDYMAQTGVDLWDALVLIMDDDACARVHDELAPCSRRDFLRRYLEVAPCDLCIG